MQSGSSAGIGQQQPRSCQPCPLPGLTVHNCMAGAAWAWPDADLCQGLPRSPLTCIIQGMIQTRDGELCPMPNW